MRFEIVATWTPSHAETPAKRRKMRTHCGPSDRPRARRTACKPGTFRRGDAWIAPRRSPIRVPAPGSVTRRDMCSPVAVGSFVGPNVAEPGRIWLVPLSARCVQSKTFAGNRAPATMAPRCFTPEKSQGRGQAQAGWHPANSFQCSAPRWARPDPSSPEKRARKSSARTWTRSERSRSVRMGSGFRATRLGRSSTRRGPRTWLWAFSYGKRPQTDARSPIVRSF